MIIMKRIKLFLRPLLFWIQRRFRGWSNDECWNINSEFLRWLNIRLKQYLKDADSIVDLDYHKFIYLENEYTQKQLILTLIDNTDWMLKDDVYDWTEEYMQKQNETLDIFKLIFNTLWW